MKNYLPKGTKFICDCGTPLYEATADLYTDTAITAKITKAIPPQHEAINGEKIICHNCGDELGSCICNLIILFHEKVLGQTDYRDRKTMGLLLLELSKSKKGE